MSFLIMTDACRALLTRIVEERKRKILFLRKRRSYGGKKGRSAARRIRQMGGDWLYSPVDTIVADLTGVPQAR
jgi:hypothetical protein